MMTSETVTCRRGLGAGAILLLAALLTASPAQAQTRSGTSPGSGGRRWGFQLGLGFPLSGSTSAKTMLAALDVMLRMDAPMGPREGSLRLEVASGIEAHFGRFGDGVELLIPLRIGVLHPLADLWGRVRPGVHAGLALNYHHWDTGMEGVYVRDQLRPGIQAGVSLTGQLGRRLAMDIRLEHAVSLTSGLTLELAGMRIPDPGGYRHQSTSILMGLLFGG